MARWTNNSDVNDQLDKAVAHGWEVSRGRSGTLRISPPPAVLEKNPDLSSFLTVHGTPSSPRAATNLRVEMGRYRGGFDAPKKRKKTAAPELSTQKSFFCRQCGAADSPTFLTEDDLATHCKAVHTAVIEPSETTTSVPGSAREGFWTKARKDSRCPFCDWCKDQRAIRQHIKRAHPRHYARIRPDLLTIEGVLAAKHLSWEPVATKAEVPQSLEVTELFSFFDVEADELSSEAQNNIERLWNLIAEVVAAELRKEQ